MDETQRNVRVLLPILQELVFKDCEPRLESVFDSLPFVPTIYRLTTVSSRRFFIFFPLHWKIHLERIPTQSNIRENLKELLTGWGELTAFAWREATGIQSARFRSPALLSGGEGGVKSLFPDFRLLPYR